MATPTKKKAAAKKASSGKGAVGAVETKLPVKDEAVRSTRPGKPSTVAASLDPTDGPTLTPTKDPDYWATVEKEGDGGHLLGVTTIGELFASPAVKDGLNDSDRRAFRLGATLVEYMSKELDSWAVFCGYLLTAPLEGDHAETAITKIVWHQYAQRHPNQVASDQVDFWNAFEIAEQREELEREAETKEVDATKMSPRLRALIQSSLATTKEAVRPRPFYTRHLLGCMLGPLGNDLDSSVIRNLRQFDTDPLDIAVRFRNWLSVYRRLDDPKALDKMLGVTVVEGRPPWPRGWRPLRAGEGRIASSGGDESTGSEKWLDHVAQFSTGMVQFEDDREIKDALKVEDYVRRFAQIIALRGTELPLSIGLFGEWGAGKTYFMKLLRQEIRGLGAREGNTWCREVAAVRFNAWHYVDSDLWASLVTEIFDQLFTYLAGEDADDCKRLEKATKMLRQLEKVKGAAAGAEENLADIKKQAQKAQEDLRKRERQARLVARIREDEELFLAGALDSLKMLVPEEKMETEWRDALETLGLKDLTDSLQDMEKQVGEFRSLGGRLKALGLELTSASGRRSRLFYLIGAVVVVPLVAASFLGKLPGFKDWLGQGVVIVGQVACAIAGGVAWLSEQSKNARVQLGRVEEFLRAARKKRSQRATDEDVVKAQKKVRRFAELEQQAEEKVRTARAKVRALQEELRELRPERRLYRFIEERASAKDYRQHLGLVSLVRKDFRELSRLFVSNLAGQSEWKKLFGQEEKSIDRIVLYVDDLDRCQPDRVVQVLEAVHLLLDFPLFVAVVAVDPRWVKQSLRAHYARLLGGAAETRIAANGAGTVGGPLVIHDDERQATPLDYLEKIFHIPFHLPAMRKDAYEDLMTTLAGKIKEPTGTIHDTVESREVEATGSETLNTASDVESGDDSAGKSVQSQAEHEVRSSSAGSSDGPENSEKGAQKPVPQKEEPLGLVELDTWDLKELKRFDCLINTPRAAKRFINTYRLIRAGVGGGGWDDFRADHSGGAECRVAMLLLAAAAGYPSVAREWFEVIKTNSSSGIFAVFEADPPERPENWDRFKKAFDQVWTTDVPRELFADWIDRVERFAF